MGQITVEKNVGGIEGLCVITPAVHGDNRGYFMETYNQAEFAAAGLNMTFVQEGCSSPILSAEGVDDLSVMLIQGFCTSITEEQAGPDRIIRMTIKK